MLSNYPSSKKLADYVKSLPVILLVFFWLCYCWSIHFIFPYSHQSLCAHSNLILNFHVSDLTKTFDQPFQNTQRYPQTCPVQYSCCEVYVLWVFWTSTRFWDTPRQLCYQSYPISNAEYTQYCQVDFPQCLIRVSCSGMMINVLDAGVNRVKEKQLLLVGVYLLLSAILVDSSVTGNRPPRFIIDEQTEIVIRLKEGPDTPAGKFFCLQDA